MWTAVSVRHEPALAAHYGGFSLVWEKPTRQITQHCYLEHNAPNVFAEFLVRLSKKKVKCVLASLILIAISRQRTLLYHKSKAQRAYLSRRHRKKLFTVLYALLDFSFQLTNVFLFLQRLKPEKIPSSVKIRHVSGGIYARWLT